MNTRGSAPLKGETSLSRNRAHDEDGAPGKGNIGDASGELALVITVQGGPTWGMLQESGRMSRGARDDSVRTTHYDPAVDTMSVSILDRICWRESKPVKTTISKLIDVLA